MFWKEDKKISKAKKKLEKKYKKARIELMDEITKQTVKGNYKKARKTLEILKELDSQISKNL